MNVIGLNHIKSGDVLIKKSAKPSTRLVEIGLLRGNTGFTLLELLISLSLIAISMLGLLSLTTTSIQANLENDVRNAAVRLTGQTSELLFVQPIDSVVTCGLHSEANDPDFNAAYTHATSNVCLEGGGAEYERYPNPKPTIRGTIQYPYNVTWTVSNLSNDLRQVDIKVKYLYKGKTVEKNSVVYKHRAL